MLIPLKNTCLFLENLIRYNFILNNFKIKVMAPQISDNFLFGGIFFKIGQFCMFFNLAALATFIKNNPFK